MIKAILEYLIRLIVADVRRRHLVVSVLKESDLPVTLQEFLKNPIEGNCWVWWDNDWYISYYIDGRFTNPEDEFAPDVLLGIEYVQHILCPEAPK